MREYLTDAEWWDRLVDQVKVWTKYPSIADFIERERVLPPEFTPMAGTGRFSYDMFPYYRRILEYLHPDNECELVALMKGSQIGATTGILESFIFYCMFANPCAQLFVTADKELLKKQMARIDRMLLESGKARSLRSQTTGKATGTTLYSKEYRGGFLHGISAKAPNQALSISYPVIAADEVDTYKAFIPGVGDFVDFLFARSMNYSFRSTPKKKLLVMSAPRLKQTSIIWRLYSGADRLKYFVPCPRCGEMQELEWRGRREDGTVYGIVFDVNEKFAPVIETVGYSCRYCRGIIKNDEKRGMIPQGEWRATNPDWDGDPLKHSFHLSPLYNPPGLMPWEDMVRKFAGFWDYEHDRLRDKEKYVAFVRDYQGLPWFDRGEGLTYERVQGKRQDYLAGKIPNGLVEECCGGPILLLIASVDVQRECLYFDLKGYGPRGSVWTIDFRQIEGDTDCETGAGPWAELRKLIESRWRGDDGKEYVIAFTLVDSGFRTSRVYDFCRGFPEGVAPCKGARRLRRLSGATYQMFSRKTLDDNELKFAFEIDTTKMKDMVARTMNDLSWKEGEAQPPWYPNFPFDFRDDYFKMFTAEHAEDVFDRYHQYQGRVWRLNDSSLANHAFDTYAYNLAALEIWAEAICSSELYGLVNKDEGILNWPVFWDYALKGAFYMEKGK